jgi:2-keto-4-pentenoate hydratase
MSSSESTTASGRLTAAQSALADNLLVALESGVECTVDAGDTAVTSIEEAYAVQDSMVRRLGYTVTGWKIGVPAHEQAITGAVPPGRVVPSPGHFSLAGRTQAYLEAEISVTLADTLDGRDHEVTAEEARAAVGALHIGFELVCSRIANLVGNLSLDYLRADFGGAALLVKGDDIDTGTLAAAKMQLIHDGELVQEKAASSIDPYSPLAELANIVGARGLVLKVGDTVTTGEPIVCSGAAGQFEARCGSAKAVLDITA